MSRPSILRSFLQRWFFLLTLVITAVACGGRSDEGLLPPDLDGGRRDGGDAMVDGDSSSDISLGEGGFDARLPDGTTVLPDGAVVLPDGGVVPPRDGSTISDVVSEDGRPVATLIRIAIDPPVLTLAASTMQTLTVTGTYSDGTTATLTQGVTFSSSAAATASVSATGVVTAVAAGNATITATRAPEGLTATAGVTVTAATVKSIDVTPVAPTTGIDGTVQFAAVATLNDGSHQTVTSSVTWSSSAPAIATIGTMSTTAGLAKGVAAGTATIRAVMMPGNVTGTATLTVTDSRLVSIAITPPNPVYPIGYNFTFKATATYADGKVGDVTNTVQWTSSTTTVAAIGAATGTGTTAAAGMTTITASLASGGMTITGTTNLTVTAATLTGITVEPATNALIVGLTKQLKATGRYNNNTTADLTTSVAWSSSNATSAFVSNADPNRGLVSALAAGTSTITATLNNVSGTATVTVSEAKLVSIAITPATPSVPNGATIPLVANGTYDNGVMADVTALVTWTAADATVATISNAAGSNGQATGRKVGTTQVTATSGGITASVTLTVTAAVPQSVEVTPANPNVQITRTQAMVATGIYTDGSRVDVTTLAAWTTGRAATATVSNGAGSQGVVTAVAVGTTTVTATWSGLMGSTNINVTPAIPTSIAVTPADVTIATNATQNYTAVVIYDIGTQATVTAQCMWTSSNTAVATIALGGGGGGGGQTATARGLGGGDTTITCTYTAAGVTITGTGTLHVKPPVSPVSLNITPDPATITTGGTQAFVATVVMSDMTTITVTNTATWTSSDATIASVSTTGAARGAALGNKEGMVTITASYNASGVTVTGTAALTVEGTPTGVTISPGNASIKVGATQNYTLAATYSNGGSKTLASNSPEVLCTSSDINIATIQVVGNNRQGACVGAGSVTLTCTYTPTGSTTSVSGTTPLTCIDKTPTSIAVAPSSTTIALGDTVQFTATVTYSDNTTAVITTNANASWTSSAPTIASVDDTGMTKGQVKGVTQSATAVTITVTFLGVQGTASVTVGPKVATGLVISPITAMPNPGATIDYTATLTYSDSTSLDVTATATWTATGPATDGGPAIVTIANSGNPRVVTAVSVGRATVTATYTAGGTTFTQSVNITVQ